MSSVKFQSVHRWLDVCCLLVLVLVAIPLSRAQAGDSLDPIVGDWKLVDVLDSVDNTWLDDAAANKLLGKVMSIRRSGAQFDNHTCQPPEDGGRMVEPEMYLQKEGRIDNAKLKLPTPVLVFEISCSYVFVRSENEVVLTWGGYFFQAHRVRK